MKNLKNKEIIVKPSNAFRILSLIFAGVMPSVFLAGLTTTLMAGQKIEHIYDDVLNSSSYQTMLNYEIDKQYNSLKNEDITYNEYFSELKEISKDKNYNEIFEKSEPELYEQYLNAKKSEILGTAIATTAGTISTMAMFHAVNEARKIDKENSYIEF